MSKQYKNFILPPRPQETIASLKDTNVEGYARVYHFLESMVDVALAMTQTDDREVVRNNLHRSIDSGVSSFAVTADGVVYVVMWNFDRGEYLQVNEKNFDRYDYATLLRMSDILTKWN